MGWLVINMDPLGPMGGHKKTHKSPWALMIIYDHGLGNHIWNHNKRETTIYIYIYTMLWYWASELRSARVTRSVRAFGADSEHSHFFALFAPFSEAFRSSPLEPNAL